MDLDAMDPACLMERLSGHERANADTIGQRAQTAHQHWCLESDPAAEGMWEVARAAARRARPRLRRLRLVTITTDSRGSFAAWMRSLRESLEDAGWRAGDGPEVQVLRVANDADRSIDAEHQTVSAEGIVVHVIPTDLERRPLPLPEARPFAFRCLRDLGWTPSPDSPVWSLDEDFRFETLVPSPRLMFARRSGGPLLHRLDALVSRLADKGVDALIGGNSGAAPVPALGLVLSQVEDLVRSGRVPDLAAELGRLARLADAYYDLAENRASELRLPLVRAWWRVDGMVDMSEVTTRLRAGLPVTRPALAMPMLQPPDAWASHENVVVAGGNTVLLSPRALDGCFVHVRYRGLVSRRADTTWCIDARERGARVARVCLPLFHDRQARPKTAAEAAGEAVADALGVGVYRAMLLGHAHDEPVIEFARARLETLHARLVDAERSTREVGSSSVAALAEWITEARAGVRAASAELPSATGKLERVRAAASCREPTVVLASMNG